MSSTSQASVTRESLATRMLLQPLAPLAIALILVIVILSFVAPNFATASNLTNVLLQSSIVGVAAVGATFVILTGGIDLSQGAVLAVSGMTVGVLLQDGLNPFLGIAICVGIGALFGAFNGAAVAWLRLVPFITTLATLGIARGLTLFVSGGQAAFDLPEAFLWLGGARVWGIPVPVIVMALVYILGIIVLRKTTFGHKVYAVGGNPEAARLAGIKVRRILFSVYVLSGAMAALASVLLIGRLQSATPASGTGLELDVIAAVVIGGTSLFGGRGSLVGTLLGVLLIATINNGLVLLNVSPYLITMVQGAIIFLAVLLDSLASRRARRG